MNRGHVSARPGLCARYVAWCCVVVAAAVHGASAAEAPADEKSVDYVIVATGTELLAGGYADAHGPFLTRTLHPRGLHCVLIMIVDDRLEEIEKAVRLASQRAPLVIVTGGLGPTEDDATRQAISKATGIPLVEHPELLEAVSKRFHTPIDQLLPNLRRQTQTPKGGRYLENPHGTAAGLVFETDRGLIVALPGPPRELQPMVHEQLLPLLAERFGIAPVGGLLRIRFVGIGESSISDAIQRHVPIPNDVTIGSLFDGMRVDYYFSLRGSTPEDLARLDVLKQQVYSQLGDFIYGTGATTLESCVVDLFANRHETLALAEVGTGGSIAASLGSAAAVADVLAGAYVAPDEQRLFRLFAPTGQHASEKSLVDQLAQTVGADWAVYVGPIREDSAAGRYIEVRIHRPDGRTESKTLNWRGSGDLGRFNLTTQVLDCLRKALRP